MLKKSKITFVVPTQLQKELNQQILQDNYGMRGKSKWISEAIKDFLKMETFVEMVNLADGMAEFEKMESVMTDFDTKKSLNDAILKIRQRLPLLEGVQSRIIRASIIQRLIKS